MDTPATTRSAAFADALATADGLPTTAFKALHALADDLVGARMFTVLAFDFANRVAHRLYSSEETLYPTGARDPLGDTIWERTLIGERRPLVLNDPAAMATLLPNADELVRLGYAAMLNLPVVVAGQSLAAINILHDSGRYTAERVDAAKALAPAAAALLLWLQSRK